MTENASKKTPLYDFHVANGAKMVPFAGYDMPLMYPLGIMKEHLHTRAAAGLFDISHMMHVELEGPQAADLIARLCPYDPQNQKIGVARYTYFLNEHAGVIDDLIITRLGDERYLLVCNAGCADKDFAHISTKAKAFDVRVAKIPRAFIALQGPKAETAMAACGLDVAEMNFLETKEVNGWFISRSGYTGEDGFEVALPNDQATGFVEKLAALEDVEPIGLGARDSLRIEAGLSLYGQDITDEITPHEAGLIWAIPKELRAGGDYIGAAALAEKIAEGRQRMRIGLSPVDKTPVRPGAILLDGGGNEIGAVTSGGFGPSIGKPVALGLINVAAKDGEIFAQVRKKTVPMAQVKLPFVPHNYKHA